MIPMSELVKDPDYRRYLQTPPVMPRIARDSEKYKRPPWVVYIQKDANGPWGKKEFWAYKDAFKFMARHLKAGAYDAALNNRRIGFDPPYRFVRIKGKYVTGSDGERRQATKRVPWRPRLLPEDREHLWCRYCRRPTTFRYFRKHKAFGSQPVDSTIKRCTICGASTRIALAP